MNIHAPSRSFNNAEQLTGRPSREETEAAYATILRYAGEDPHRDGLLETPARAAAALVHAASTGTASGTSHK